MKFDRESYVHGQFPEFGAIFMSNSATKKECFRRKLFGLPPGQTHFVQQVKAGMILFLFEFERRELHGVFQACSDGAINIVPAAYKSSGKQFPAQVKFTQIWNCSPLRESEFRDAIKENYFSANKFNFGLSEKQVQKLLSLFSLRRLQDNNFDRHLSQSKVGRQDRRAVNIIRNAVDNDNFLAMDDDKHEENANVNFGSGSSKCSEDYVNSYIRAIDADMRASTSVGYGHKAETDFRMQHFGNPLDRLGRSVDDVQLLTRNEVGKECDVDNDPRSVGVTDYYGHPLNTTRIIPNLVRNEMISGQGNKWNEHDAFQPRLSTEYLDSFQSNPPVYSSKSISDKVSLMNDQLLNSSTVDSSLAPQKSNFFYSLSRQDPVHTNSPCLPYDPDVPALNYMHSWPPGLSESVPSRSIPSSIFPHIENQSLSSCGEPKSTSRCQDINTEVSDNVPLSSPDLDIFPYSKNMYSISEKKRQSVFSRLALPAESSEQGVGHVECGIHSSVEEIMAMLHDSHFDWVKVKSFKKLTKRQDDITDLRKKRQVTANSRLSEANSEKISKEGGRHHISSGEEEVIQKVEQLPSLDFKRRSEVRKFQGDASSKRCNEIVENNESSNGQRKRRKLIRPKFSMNESSDDVTAGNMDKRGYKSEIFELRHVDNQKNVDNEQNLHIGFEKDINAEKNSDYEREKNVDNSALSFRDAAEERKEESEIFELLHVDIPKQIDNEQNLHINCEEKKTNVEKNSCYERDENVETSALSLKNAAEEEKEECMVAGLQNVPFSTFQKGERCEDKQELTFNNSEDDGLSRNSNDTGCSVSQESFLEVRTGKLATVANCGSDHNVGGDNKTLQDFEFVDKSCPIIDGRTRSDSMKHNSESEKFNKEFGNGKARNNSDLLESVAGQCNAYIETVSYGNMQESSDNGNVERSAAIAGNDHKMKMEVNVGNGNHILSNCRETITSESELCSSNQSLSSFEDLVNVCLSSEGKDREMQSLEFIAI